MNIQRVILFFCVLLFVSLSYGSKGYPINLSNLSSDKIKCIEAIQTNTMFGGSFSKSPLKVTFQNENSGQVKIEIISCDKFLWLWTTPYCEYNITHPGVLKIVAHSKNTGYKCDYSISGNTIILKVSK